MNEHIAPRSGPESEQSGANESSKAEISEELGAGCGICVHKCPFTAIKIIGLPDELKEEMVHQYGERLPALSTAHSEDRPGHRYPRSERYRQDDLIQIAIREIVPNLR